MTIKRITDVHTEHDPELDALIAHAALRDRVDALKIENEGLRRLVSELGAALGMDYETAIARWNWPRSER